MSYTIKYRVKTRRATGVAVSTERVKDQSSRDFSQMCKNIGKKLKEDDNDGAG